MNDSFKEKINRELDFYKSAIEKKPSKNNIYDTYSYYLEKSVGTKDEDFIYKQWKKHADDIRSGRSPNDLNFYIHVPFCTSNCDYCVYPSVTLKHKSQLHDYLNFLIEKMKKFSPLFYGLKFKSLYIGGGTPSIFSPEQLEKLLSSLFSLFGFEELGDKAIEFNPATTTKEKLHIIKKHGLNRVSFGVQSLSERVLRLNNRHSQNMKSILKSAMLIRQARIRNYSMDMILGLKGDSSSDFLETFSRICDLKPTHIFVYPIKTNEDYLKKNYGTFRKFQRLYYPLYDSVTKKIIPLANKKGYLNNFELETLSYVSPLTFTKKGRSFIPKYNYAHHSHEPDSIFGLGYFSQGRIANLISYTFLDIHHQATLFLKDFSTDSKDYAYSVRLFLPGYEKVKFIIAKFHESREVSRAEYKKLFGSDIVSDFSYGIRALECLDALKVQQEKVIFNNIDEKLAYPYLLFFVDRRNVRRRLKEGLTPDNIPESKMDTKKHILGRVQITRECNQECIYCSAPPAAQELDFEEIKKRIRNLKKLGTTDLMLTGGEPTVKKDLFEILDFIESQGFSEKTIQTNGANLDSEDFLRKIKQYKNIKFNISFHSYKPEVFAKISKRPEHYRRLLQGLGLIGRLGIPAYITIVISKLNYLHLKEHIQFIHERFPHLTHFSFNFIDPIYRADQNRWTVPTFAETEKYIHETADYMKKHSLTFRIEKLPLCYMSGFEEYSSDIRRGVFDESRIMNFLRTKDDTDSQELFIEKDSRFIFSEQCRACRLNSICPGINPHYAKVHGTGEVFPVFDDPDKIIGRIKNTKSTLKNHND